jgi:hypothetical protein
MRLGPLVLLALIAVVAPSPSYAQTQTSPSPDHQLATLRQIAAATAGVALAEPARGTARPDDVVARLMSFDRNNDGKVQKAELAERMYAVMDRGDADGDGALDRDELLTLATARPAEAAVRGFGHGRYMIGSDTDVSFRRHLEGAIEDLRLEAVRQDPALAIVRTFSDTRDARAKAELLDVMGNILSPEQLTDFTAALERQLPARVFRTVTRGSAASEGPQRIVTFVTGGDLERRVATFDLQPEANDRATAALERYRSRVRLNETERSELGRQLTSVLTTGESEDFLAAIARQPVAEAGGFIVQKGTVLPPMMNAAPVPVKQ